MNSNNIQSQWLEALSESQVLHSHVSRCRLTDAFSLICHSNRSAEETGSSSQVTGAGIDDPVVSTQVLLRRRHLGANPITRHTIRVICLVHDAGGAAGAQDVTAGFCPDKENRNFFFCVKNDAECKKNENRPLDSWHMQL